MYLRISIQIMSILVNYCQHRFLKLQAATWSSFTLQTIFAILEIYCFNYLQRLKIDGIKEIKEYIKPLQLRLWACILRICRWINIWINLQRRLLDILPSSHQGGAVGEKPKMNHTEKNRLFRHLYHFEGIIINWWGKKNFHIKKWKAPISYHLIMF